MAGRRRSWRARLRGGAPRRDGARLRCGSSFTRAGRVYLSQRLPGKTWASGIFSTRSSADGHTDIGALDSTINVPNAIDCTPWVAPDESFLLFASNRSLVGDRGDMHVHVSFRAADGAWSPPRRATEIPGRFPSLSPDGCYLFFCRDDGDFYWTDARIVESLRPRRATGGSWRR